MATYNICGLECGFFNIPHGVLETYHPTPRTFVIAWKCPNPTLQLTLQMLLNSAYELQAIERPPFLVEDGGRFVYLIEHPHPTIFESIERWGHWACGASFVFVCPYREKKHVSVQRFYADWDDLIFTPTKSGTRPLLRDGVLSKMLDPIPDLYDQAYRPIQTPSNQL